MCVTQTIRKMNTPDDDLGIDDPMDDPSTGPGQIDDPDNAPPNP